MKRAMMIAAAVAALVPAIAAAQRNPVRGQGRRGLPAQGQPDSMRPNREALEERVRQRFAEVMRNQLGLTDAQMVKVREINMKYAGRRRALLEQEREIRMSLRQEVVAADSSRQGQVADLLDRMTKAQRQRLDVLEAEQRDLAGVLTPLQRATYIGLEEQLRQRIEGMRGQGPGRMGPGGPPNGPPNGDPNAGGVRPRRVPPPDGAAAPPAGGVRRPPPAS